MITREIVEMCGIDGWSRMTTILTKYFSHVSKQEHKIGSLVIQQFQLIDRSIFCVLFLAFSAVTRSETLLSSPPDSIS